MKLIYIAGKYTAPSRCAIQANIQAAREAADAVARMGAFPVTPHLLGQGLEDAGDEQFWYDGTLELMLRCDAIFLVEGWDQSKGAREELTRAKEKGLPFFHSEAALSTWLGASLPWRVSDLVFSQERCKCGLQLAYVRGGSSDVWQEWRCSGVLVGSARQGPEHTPPHSRFVEKATLPATAQTP